MPSVDPITIGILGMIALIVLILLGVHIAFAMFSISFLGIFLVSGLKAALGTFAWAPYSIVSSWTLAAIPLFIIMGELAAGAGFTKDVFRTAKNWLGSFPGGLAMASTLGCAIFSAASGSALACASVMGRVIVPELIECNYDRGLATGSVAASATLDPLIPPSIILVIFGIMTGESISKLLIAGIVPGIISAILYMLMIFVRAWLNPSIAPKVAGVSWRERFTSLKGTIGILVIGFVVMAGLYTGVCTPTESGGLGALMALCAVFMFKRLSASFQSLWATLIETTKSSSKIFLILLAATIFSRFLVITQLTPLITRSLVAFAKSPYVFILLMFIVYFFLGCFLDSLSMMAITIPVFMPSVIALGIHPIWFGIFVVKLIGIGCITPPVGMTCYVLNSVVPEVGLATVFRGCLWFIVMDAFCVLFFVLYPEVVLFLPNKM